MTIISLETSPAIKSLCVEAIAESLLEFSCPTSLLSLRINVNIESSVVLAFLTNAL